MMSTQYDKGMKQECDDEDKDIPLIQPELSSAQLLRDVGDKTKIGTDEKDEEMEELETFLSMFPDQTDNLPGTSRQLEKYMMASSATTRPTPEAMRVSISNDSSSASSSSSSPHYSTGSDGENRSVQSRFNRTIAPSSSTITRNNGGIGMMVEARLQMKDDDESERTNASSRFALTLKGNPSKRNGSSSSSSSLRRRCGRQSRDEELAASLGLPVTAAEIVDMYLHDFQKLLESYPLNDQQKQLIKKIRRRGKNKAAARSCRERREQEMPSYMSRRSIKRM